MLSNTAVPIYYGAFRDAVLRGDIPINREIAMQMERIDNDIANPNFYYDDQAAFGSQTLAELEDASGLRESRSVFVINSILF